MAYNGVNPVPNDFFQVATKSSLLGCSDFHLAVDLDEYKLL